MTEKKLSSAASGFLGVLLKIRKFAGISETGIITIKG
jgi:hypothetical protein